MSRCYRIRWRKNSRNRWLRERWRNFLKRQKMNLSLEFLASIRINEIARCQWVCDTLSVSMWYTFRRERVAHQEGWHCLKSRSGTAFDPGKIEQSPENVKSLMLWKRRSHGSAHTLPENEVSRLSVAGRDRGVVADLIETKNKKHNLRKCYGWKAIAFPLVLSRGHRSNATAWTSVSSRGQSWHSQLPLPLGGWEGSCEWKPPEAFLGAWPAKWWGHRHEKTCKHFNQAVSVTVPACHF